MQDLQVVEVRGRRVLTSAQIAECYETTRDCIKHNFYINKSRFIEGKHYIALVGNELKAFKNKVTNCHLARNRTQNEVEKNALARDEAQNEVRNYHSDENKAKYQFDTQFKYAKSLYLWTEKGALLHAKSLNTDKAWEVYDYLVDFYFRAKGEQKAVPAIHTEEAPKTAKEPYDIAPFFRDIITYLPLDALDAMEKSLRSGTSRAVKLAGMAVLAEKMRRQMA